MGNEKDCGKGNETRINKKLVDKATKNHKTNIVDKDKKNVHNIWKVTTWSTKSINGKGMELENEFERSGVQLTGLTETKEKRKGPITLKNEHVIWYSGVDIKDRATAEVGCLIHRNIISSVYKCDHHSERIIFLELRSSPQKYIETIIIAYGLNEDDKIKEKAIVGRNWQAKRKYEKKTLFSKRL